MSHVLHREFTINILKMCMYQPNKILRVPTKFCKAIIFHFFSN